MTILIVVSTEGGSDFLVGERDGSEMANDAFCLEGVSGMIKARKR